MKYVRSLALLARYLAVFAMIPVLQSAAAQQPPRGTSAIEGSVVRFGSGTPISGATVELTPVGPAPEGVFRYGSWITQPGPRYTASTDIDGKFLIQNAPAGTYRLHATQALGFVLTEYGQRSANGRGQPVTLTAGQRLRGIQLVMTPAGSISGRIIDSDGEPVVRGQVQAFRPTYTNGRRALRVIQSVQTNDLGEYRLFWLPPGSYFVGARSANPHTESAQMLISPPGAGGTFETASSVQSVRRVDRGVEIEEALVSVYYPGTVDSQNASAVELHAGESLGGLDFPLGSGRIRSRHVRGVVINQLTNQPGNAMVILAPSDPSSEYPVPSATADPNGFDIAGVLAGRYVLFVIGNGGITLQPLEVGDNDVQDVKVGVGPRRFDTFQGRIFVEGSSRDRGADLARLQVKVEREPNLAVLPPPPPPPPGIGPSGVVSASGEFRLNFLPPGEYRVSLAGLPPDLYLKSARIGNIDLLTELLRVGDLEDRSIGITLSARPGILQGRILDEKQQPAAGVTVALVPDPARRKRLDLYKDTTTDESGKFEFQGVAEGNFKVYAWEEVEPSAWQNEEFLRSFESRGKAIRMDEASRQEIEVFVIGAQR